jgi:hypothetical protein
LPLPADGVDVGVFRKPVAKGLRRGEAAREADVDEAGIGDRVERDLERDRGAGLQHVVQVRSPRQSFIVKPAWWRWR